MKRRSVMYILILVVSAFCSSHSQAQLIKTESLRFESGQVLSDRIRHLKAINPSLRAALAAFEKNGRAPKMENSRSISGKLLAPARKAHHAQGTISGDGVEMTFIPVVDLSDEWQGTVVTSFSDGNGVVYEQYVADVVITRSPYNRSDWTCHYDVKYEADGTGYINHRPGMFTDFYLGVPVANQAPPLDLKPSQFQSTDQRTWFYQAYPAQAMYDQAAGGDPNNGGGRGGIQPIQPIQFHHARPQVRHPGQVQQLSQWVVNPFAGWTTLAGARWPEKSA